MEIIWKGPRNLIFKDHGDDLVGSQERAFLWINPGPIVDFRNTYPKAFGEYAKGPKTLGTLSCNNFVQGYLEPILQEK